MQINERGYANVVPASQPVRWGTPPREVAAGVYGVLFTMTAADEEALDGFEGVEDGLYGKQILEVAVRGAAAAGGADGTRPA